MRKIRVLNGWGIYQNNEKEVKEYGFNLTVLHPDNMEYSYLCSPRDSDMECDTLESAVDWIVNY